MAIKINNKMIAKMKMANNRTNNEMIMKRRMAASSKTNIKTKMTKD
jgi:hypothetical protein